MKSNIFVTEIKIETANRHFISRPTYVSFEELTRRRLRNDDVKVKCNSKQRKMFFFVCLSFLDKDRNTKDRNINILYQNYYKRFKYNKSKYDCLILTQDKNGSKLT